MANAGELDRRSKLSFTALTVDSVQNARALDDDVVGRLRDICLAELECHVCYGLFVDPVTSTCGHTFCRKCIARVLDHTTLCPSCRRPMLMRPGVSNEPINKPLSQLINGLLPEELAARITSLQQEEELNPEDWMPLFPCTLAFPDMPAFLHIFEPRYRLMVRRCIENGSRKFGMVMYNSQGSIQGSLGRTQFSQYGTVLYVSRVEIFPDGRSLLETQGLHRFRVLEAGILDGYYIGRIQRIDDIPLAEEEAAEAFDMRGEEPTEGDFEGQLRHMSTQALYQYCVDFVEQARARSADWLHERMLAVFGPPPQDPAVFPFWIASILPVTDDQKYALLPVTSVRERLKITARWIRLLEEASRLLGPELEASEVAQPEEHSEMTQRASQTTEPETEPTQPLAVHDSPPGADEHPALPSSEAQSQSETETEANDEN
ncbi:hypothetical protein LTS08_001176 [Lithohypha guttulata]|uniref:uncharacterized protein n=1 Tax=Lithohypha guttulata TaxID=1690604 RepID=UPI002DDE5906|nr:hypothetical protein LTR51_007822 [Lithohypha guttulata]KAK5104905.1 hypothetical protein LTS08_001176 [Lithohypha guttulata]